MSRQPNKVQPLLAMVALNTPSQPSPTTLLASIEAISGIVVDQESVSGKDGSMSFEVGKNTVGIGLMPTPIPWRDLEGPCATAWWWQEATEKMKKHCCHILIFLGGDSGNVIERNLVLMHLTAAVATNTDTAGIYWGSGTLVHEPQAFIQEARKASLDELPIPLWIDFRIEPNGDGSYRLFTTGMKAFGSQEIEIPRSVKKPADIFDFACSIAHYIITSDATIEDGHTVGRSATEKIRATHAPSMWNSAISVLQLEF